MSRIDYNLKQVKAIAFDVDGVLSPSTIPMSADGVPQRMANIKDGYALQLAVKAGLHIAIITGADTPSVRSRYNALGIKDVYLKASQKLPIFEQWLKSVGVTAEESAYVGDDIPDLPVLQAAGLSVAPRDAAIECREAVRYVSPYDGGYGVARDLLEQILKACGQWLHDTIAFGW